MTEKQRPVIIEGAMKEEVEYLMNALQDRKDLLIGGCPAAEGTIQGVPAVVIRSFVGTVNGAVATALAIEKYQPALVISQGTAGSHMPEIGPEAIVIADRICALNCFMTGQRPAGAGMKPEDWQDFPIDVKAGEWKKLSSLPCHPCAAHAAAAVSDRYNGIFIGTIGSGDVWDKEADRIRLLHSRFGSLCEEMEGWGVGQTCSRYGVPFCVIRVISYNELTGSPFRPQTAELCQRFVEDILDIMYKEVTE